MKTTKVPDLRVPTQTQIDQRTQELRSAEKQREEDFALRRLESQAITELTTELNAGRLDALVTGAARDAGMTFVREVWPDHPAAGLLVADSIGGHNGLRPCGVRVPFRLDAEEGLKFGDYWVSSPVFPAGRDASGAVVLAFRVDGIWQKAVPLGPQRSSGRYGFDYFRSVGMQINTEPLRGRPEWADIDANDIGSRASAESTMRSAEELLWRFVNATQNEVTG